MQGFFGADFSGQHEQVKRVGQTDDTGQDPVNTVFGDQPPAGKGGGEDGRLGGKTDIGVQGHNQSHPGGRAVERGDNRLGDGREIRAEREEISVHL